MDLHGGAACVSVVLDGIEDDVVLLGDSYGGPVITEAGVYLPVAHLVYLGSWTLDRGESCGAADFEVRLRPILR